jgi:hypothetical protein
MEMASKNNSNEDFNELMNRILFEFEEFKRATKSVRSSNSKTEKKDKNKEIWVV